MAATRATSAWAVVPLLALAVTAGQASPLAADGPGCRTPTDGQAAHTYRLRAHVDTGRHRVEGQLALRFCNTSRKPLDHLMWHLYANAFRDRDSIFFREGGGALWGEPLREPGHITITALERDGVDLLPRFDTALHETDRTQARLSLERPLGPGQSLTLNLRFETQLPRMVARMGYADDFHMLAQWYPKVAKLEPDGRFDSFPYHGTGEFYGDYAGYDVTLDVPATFTAACGGADVGDPRPTADGRKRVRHQLAAAHDVACVVASDLQRHRAHAHGVEIDVLAPPGFAAAAQRQQQLVAFGLGFLQSHFGAYPYAALRVVIPPAHASPAAAMEYPGLITTGGPPWTLALAGTDLAHDVVTAHELTHQWFYGLLGSDEVSHPFLDEGLTEWVSWQLLQARHEAGRDGPAAPWSPDTLLAARGAFATHGSRLSALHPAPHYRPSQLAIGIYLRPAMALRRIAMAHGRARVVAALSRYARANRYRHPTPDDLWAAFDDEFGHGFAAAELQPLLRDERSPVPPPDGSSSGTDARSARDTWFGALLFMTQAVLRGLGP